MLTAQRIAPARRVTVELAALCTGLSAKAIRRKIEEGIWLEGQEYHRGPDGRVYVDLEGYDKWVARGLASR